MFLRRIHSAWRHRGLPVSLQSLRNCHASYSQFGEDRIADCIFGPSYPSAFYVDIGCFDPIKWSNTYLFYLKGWRGLCIDPNEALAPAWRRYRKHDLFLNLAVSDQATLVRYMILNNLPQENRLLTNGCSHPNDDTRLVMADRLDNILKQHLDKDTAINLMSIDCEGHDLVVMQSNDWTRFRPYVLIVEDHDRGANTEIDEFCASVNYALRALTGWSKIFVDLSWKR